MRNVWVCRPNGAVMRLRVPAAIEIALRPAAFIGDDERVVLHAGTRTYAFDPGTRLDFRARTLGDAIDRLLGRKFGDDELATLRRAH